MTMRQTRLEMQFEKKKDKSIRKKRRKTIKLKKKKFENT